MEQPKITEHQNIEELLDTLRKEHPDREAVLIHGTGIQNYGSIIENKMQGRCNAWRVPLHKERLAYQIPDNLDNATEMQSKIMLDYRFAIGLVPEMIKWVKNSVGDSMNFGGGQFIYFGSKTLDEDFREDYKENGEPCIDFEDSMDYYPDQIPLGFMVYTEISEKKMEQLKEVAKKYNLPIRKVNNPTTFSGEPNIKEKYCCRAEDKLVDFRTDDYAGPYWA